MASAPPRPAAPSPLEERSAVSLRGIGVDPQTRCVHYGGPRDVIALRFACCDTYYPCHACHEALADHPPERWSRARFDEPAVLCGACRATLTAREYLGCGHVCPRCGAAFNPGCAAHHDLYFQVD